MIEIARAIGYIRFIKRYASLTAVLYRLLWLSYSAKRMLWMISRSSTSATGTVGPPLVVM